MKNLSDSNVAHMFDRIARTYDFLNHFFSAGVDRRWRKRAITELAIKPHQRALDCSAGTGDMALCALRHQPTAALVLLDPAPSMLSIADAKAGLIPARQFRLVCGAAEALAFPDETFDRFMVAFGVRNFANLEVGLRELRRVLKTGGRGVVLEFTPDCSRWIDRAFHWYLRTLLPRIGGVISRDPTAYAYLARTVENFQTSAEFVCTLEATGFYSCKTVRLSLGIAKLFVVEKRAADRTAP
jgi:demethylmenaquinone methyltransferase / 2-methoxy-6-polyprenyl-1,4-benzoquinol methylase